MREVRRVLVRVSLHDARVRGGGGWVGGCSLLGTLLDAGLELSTQRQGTREEAVVDEWRGRRGGNG